MNAIFHITQKKTQKIIPKNGCLKVYINAYQDICMSYLGWIRSLKHRKNGKLILYRTYDSIAFFFHKVYQPDM